MSLFRKHLDQAAIELFENMVRERMQRMNAALEEDPSKTRCIIDVSLEAFGSKDNREVTVISGFLDNADINTFRVETFRLTTVGPVKVKDAVSQQPQLMTFTGLEYTRHAPVYTKTKTGLRDFFSGWDGKKERVESAGFISTNDGPVIFTNIALPSNRATHASITQLHNPRLPQDLADPVRRSVNVTASHRERAQKIIKVCKLAFCD